MGITISRIRTMPAEKRDRAHALARALRNEGIEADLVHGRDDGLETIGVSVPYEDREEAKELAREIETRAVYGRQEYGGKGRVNVERIADELVARGMEAEFEPFGELAEGRIEKLAEELATKIRLECDRRLRWKRGLERAQRPKKAEAREERRWNLVEQKEAV